MKNYPDEHEKAKLYQDEFNQNFEYINDQQKKQLRGKAKEWYKLSHKHNYLHNTLNLLIIIGLIAFDFALFRASFFKSILANLTFIFIMHAYVVYSLNTFTIHEGSSHNVIILGTSKLAKFFQTLVNNVPRLYFADPGFYGPIHVHHHKDFGTPQDAAFTNYVRGSRLFKCFLPLAGILPFNDYKIHGDTIINKSQRLSNIIGFFYTWLLNKPFIDQVGFKFFIVFYLGSAWLSFTLDRLRESTEHQLMPAGDRELNGARNFGLSFWGLIIGGGPWGQPCHLSHHVHPSLPWYWQCLMHFELKKVLTKKQKQQFIFDGILGWPRAVMFIFSERTKVNKRYHELHS